MVCLASCSDEELYTTKISKVQVFILYRDVSHKNRHSTEQEDQKWSPSHLTHVITIITNSETGTPLHVTAVAIKSFGVSQALASTVHVH